MRMGGPLKWALIGIGVVLAAVIGVLIALFVTYDRRTPEEFIKVWAKAVESGDTKLYEELWDDEAKEKRRAKFNEGIELVKNRPKVDLSLMERRGDEKAVTFSGIKLTFLREGERVESTRRVRIKRVGFSRSWKVVDEESYIPPAPPIERPKRERKPVLAEAEVKLGRKAPIDTELKIRQIIEDWRQAWEQKDLKRYMEKYADFAEIRRVTVIGGKEYPVKLTKQELERRMKRLWRKYTKIRVQISNLEVEGDYATADVNFLQEYKGWIRGRIAYQDLGTKQLKFVRDVKDNTWKIVSEDWKIYKKVPAYPKF